MDELALLEPQGTGDDWGDFGLVIDQLEKQETDKHNETSVDATDDAVDDVNSEALEGFLNVAFTITEQITSFFAGVDFEFDAKGKQQVIEAATPVMNKHGGRLMGVFGDYMEEATLLMALLALAYTARKELATQKAMALQRQKQEQAQREQERRAHHGEETAAAGAA